MKIDNGTEQSFNASVTIAGGQMNIAGTNSSNSLTLQSSSDTIDVLDDIEYNISYSEGNDVIFSSLNAEKINKKRVLRTASFFYCKKM